MRTMARLREELPEWAVESPELFNEMRSFAEESILVELSALKDGATIPSTCPAVDADGARRTARFGPLGPLLSGYRAGHAVQWETWFELVEQQELESAARRELLERGSHFFFAYADRLSRFVTAVYTDERERIVRTSEQRRMHVVREVLEGREGDTAALDYEIEGQHLGVVAWGPEAADTVRELAKTLDRRLLLVSVVDQSWWAWLGGSRPLGQWAATVLEAFRPPANTRLAIGTEASGRDGFRRTHHQAISAQRASLHTDAPVTRFDEIALEALFSENVDEAKAFATRELRGLDGSDKRSERLRETLRAYFATGHNAAATASRLGVHEQTVAQRLRAVEERIGRPVASRRAELETALRLLEYLRGLPASGRDPTDAWRGR